jgi:hypothetical protein
MVVSRITAAIFVGLLIGSLGLVSIGGVELIGPTLAHGSNVEHDAGTIVAIGPGTDFVLETVEGQAVHFHCSDRCLRMAAHMQRHLREHAHTDVYYVQDGQNGLIAVDVD